MLSSIRRARRGAPRRTPAGGRRGPGRGVLLLPGGRRRADHEDHRRFRRRFREGESRRQDPADLFGQLSGIDREGAHRREERRAAGDVDPAVDGHVHADRRRRHRAFRRDREVGRRPGVGEELLSRRSWRTARPAARPGAYRSSARRSCSTGTRRCSRRRGSIPTGRRPTGPSSSSTRRSSPRRDAAGKVTQWGIQIPSSGFPYWLFQALAIAERRQPDERGGHRDLLRQAGGRSRRCSTGSTWRASTRCTRQASSSGARRPRTSSSARWR